VIPGAARGRKLDVGLGWYRRRSDPPNAGHYWEHLGGGGGFFNTMRLYPEQRLGLVAMGNATNGTTYGSLTQPLKAGTEQAQLLTDCRFDSYHTRQEGRLGVPALSGAAGPWPEIPGPSRKQVLG
jgi:hypothetical protein